MKEATINILINLIITCCDVVTIGIEVKTERPVTVVPEEVT